MQELRELPQIGDKLALRKVQNVTTPDDALDANLSYREYLDELALEFDKMDNDDSERGRVVLENLRPHTNLKRLTIRNYAGTRFPSWLDGGRQTYLEKMTSLRLTGCLYFQSLPPLGQLPSLKQLEFEGTDYIVTVGPEFYGHSSPLSGSFPALESLSFKKMKGWEVWSNVDAEGSAVCFPHFRELYLYDCPKMKGNLPVHVPFLEKLDIKGCNQLASVLPQVPSIHPLVAAARPHAELASAFHLGSITKIEVGRIRAASELTDRTSQAFVPKMVENILLRTSNHYQMCVSHSSSTRYRSRIV